jgi:hypothetical protein
MGIAYRVQVTLLLNPAFPYTAGTGGTAISINGTLVQVSGNPTENTLTVTRTFPQLSTTDNITAITFNGIRAPTAGATPSDVDDITAVVTGSPASTIPGTATWWRAGSSGSADVAHTGRFAASTVYILRYTINANEGFDFTGLVAGGITTTGITSGRTFEFTPATPGSGALTINIRFNTTGTGTPINRVAFTGIAAAPVAGAAPVPVSGIHLDITDPAVGPLVRIPGTARWWRAGSTGTPDVQIEGSSYTFAPGTTYILRFTITSPPTPYIFTGLGITNVDNIQTGTTTFINNPGTVELTINIQFPPTAAVDDINIATISGIVAPVAGALPNTTLPGTVILVTGPDNGGARVTNISWFASNGTTPHNTAFRFADTYVVRVRLEMNPGFNYTIIHPVTFSINGITATPVIIDGILHLQAHFTNTLHEPITGITFGGMTTPPVTGTAANTHIAGLTIQTTAPTGVLTLLRTALSNAIPSSVSWEQGVNGSAPLAGSNFANQGDIHAFRFTLTAPTGYSLAGLTNTMLIDTAIQGTASVHSASQGSATIQILLPANIDSP